MRKREKRRRKQEKKAKDFKRGHHIIPRSRGGVDEPSNLYRWANEHHRKHQAWHTIFANLVPSEACLLIEHWMRKDGKLNLRYFRVRRGKPNKRLVAWKILFGDQAPKESIELIRREFMRKEWLNPRGYSP